jgi:hypothetical protein
MLLTMAIPLRAWQQCVRANSTTACANAYVTCVGTYGGLPDPEGSGNTLCEARYEDCVTEQNCYSVY